MITWRMEDGDTEQDVTLEDDGGDAMLCYASTATATAGHCHCMKTVTKEGKRFNENDSNKDNGHLLGDVKGRHRPDADPPTGLLQTYFL